MQLSNKYPEVGSVNQYRFIYTHIYIYINSGNISGQEIVPVQSSSLYHL
jgi:hypothetical protein